MTVRELPGPIVEQIVAGRGISTRADLVRTGLGDGQRRTLLNGGLLTKVAEGVYADAATLGCMDPWDAFMLRARGFLLAAPPDAVLCEWASAHLLGLPTPFAPPRLPSVLRPRRLRSGSDRTPWGRTRHAGVPDQLITEVDGVRTLVAGLVAADLARSCGSLTALKVADRAVRLVGGKHELEAAADLLRWWPRRAAVTWVVRHADGGADTPLETAGRFVAIRGNLPVPESNLWVGAVEPELRLDHYWRQRRLCAEGDGKEKYLKDGDPAAVLESQAERGWRLRQFGISEVRYTWRAAHRQSDELATRFRRSLELEPLPVMVPFQVWTDAEAHEFFRARRWSG